MAFVSARTFSPYMKSFRNKAAKGFTLVELLVVMAIIGAMMALAANVLRDPGRGKNISSGVQMLENMIQEARATAIGNDTYTRVIIACDEKDTANDSIHLRYVTVQKLVRDENENRKYDGTDVRREGEWVSTSSGVFLPSGVYFSPSYSLELQWMEHARDTTLEIDDSARISGLGRAMVYYIEFDEKGRFVTPDTKPGEPSRPRRLVLITGRLGNGRHSVDGVDPINTDDKGRPAVAKGLVLWPSGNYSVMMTPEQVYDENIYAPEGKSRAKADKDRKSKKKDNKKDDKKKSKKGEGKK